MVRIGVVMLLLAGSAAAARAATPDALDVALDTCLASKAAQTTAGMVGCTEAAAKGWDTRLNAAYSGLLRQLDLHSRAMLVGAQRSWVNFRAADATFSAGPWRQGAGTMAQLLVASSRMDELRTRARALEAYRSGG